MSDEVIVTLPAWMLDDLLSITEPRKINDWQRRAFLDFIDILEQGERK